MFRKPSINVTELQTHEILRSVIFASLALRITKCSVGNLKLSPVFFGCSYAEENGLLFMETSAKTGSNVSAIFMAVARAIPRETEESKRRRIGARSLRDTKTKSSPDKVDSACNCNWLDIQGKWRQSLQRLLKEGGQKGQLSYIARLTLIFLKKRVTWNCCDNTLCIRVQWEWDIHTLV